MKLKLVYYAVFREQSGMNSEEYETTSSTPSQLYEELAKRFGYQLPANLVRAAVNGRFVGMTDSLAEGDEVVFIPPVAGG